MIRPIYAHEKHGVDKQLVRNAGHESDFNSPNLPIYYNGRPLAGNHSYGNILFDAWDEVSGKNAADAQIAQREADQAAFDAKLAALAGNSSPSPQSIAPVVASVLVLGLIGWAVFRRGS
jgi:hypothetical protein